MVIQPPLSGSGWRLDTHPGRFPRRLDTFHFLDGSYVKNRGSGGGGIKTRSVFPDAVPRWRFAYFADTGKVGRPGGRNHPPPNQHPKTRTGRSDENGHSYRFLFLRAQRRSVASQKVLCQAFFQESGEAALLTSYKEGGFVVVRYWALFRPP